jgi:hypothetical protein
LVVDLMTDAQADSCAALFPREQEPRPSPRNAELVLRAAVDAVDERVVPLGGCSQNGPLSGGRGSEATPLNN